MPTRPQFLIHFQLICAWRSELIFTIYRTEIENSSILLRTSNNFHTFLITNIVYFFLQIPSPYFCWKLYSFRKSYTVELSELITVCHCKSVLDCIEKRSMWSACSHLRPMWRMSSIIIQAGHSLGYWHTAHAHLDDTQAHPNCTCQAHSI
jgi:hypothetical protein